MRKKNPERIATDKNIISARFSLLKMKFIYKRIHNLLQKTNFISKRELYFLGLFLFAVFLLYSYIAVNLHNQYLTFALDLGVFDEWIWKISRFRFPYSGVGCIWMLEDHFQLILFLFAPLYWIWNNVRVILIGQSFLMVLAAMPLYQIGKFITKNKFFSFSMVIAYLFFIGTQFAVLNEFHQVTAAPLFIALLYYGLLKENRRIFFLGILGLLLTKEDLSLLVAAIGLGMFFSGNYRKTGAVVLITGILFFIFQLYFFMPLISFKKVYSHLDFGTTGYSPSDVILNMFKNPRHFFELMVSPPVKLRTVFISLFTFSFLPIFAPLFSLIPLAQDFIVRFIYSGPQYTKWGLVNHHAATGAMLLAVNALYGGKYFALRLFSKRKNVFYLLSGIFLIIFTSFADFYFHGPVNSVFKKQFYYLPQWVIDNNEIIKSVPQNVSVSAQNNLAPHLTHRQDIYRFPYGLNSEYMVFDLNDGPNKYAPLSYIEVTGFVNGLIKSGRYSVVKKQGKSLLLKRNYKTDITESKYFGDTRYCYYSLEER